MIDTNELRNDANTAHYGHMPLEISGSEMLELLDRLEAAEKELVELRYGAVVANDTIKALHAIIAAVKKQADAEFRIRVKKEGACARLQAKIEQMERQKPVAWTTRLALESVGRGTLGFHACGGNMWGYKGVALYALPGAKGE